GVALVALRLARLIVLGLALGGFARGIGLLLLVLFVLIIVARAALLLEAGAILVEDAEIMVRILEIIFGLDPIPAHLRVAGHALILFQQLGGIAALAVVLAIAGTRIAA